jgi:hypothetical protein
MESTEEWPPCENCGEYNMDWNMCPNYNEECNECCGCEDL